ncbi:hypothetical protein FRC03_003676 [Tulasnella sp. 419]|nr:hypothetical protein FRC03_003676 [Tulasnella sp. 419]
MTHCSNLNSLHTIMNIPTLVISPSEPLVRPSTSSLPPELLFIIFRYMWSRLDAQRVSLANCSLVCTTWRPVAQELLFTEVVLRRESAAQSFLSAIKEEPKLGRVTRILNIKVYPWPSSAQPQLHRVSRSTTYEVTTRCPLLYQINLEVSNYLNGTALKALFHHQTFEKLQALYLCLESEFGLEPKVTVQDVFQFLNHFHTLSHLRLCGIPQLASTYVPAIPLSAPSYQLFEFGWMNHLGRPDLPICPDFDLITDWLFSASSEKLRIFELEDDDRDAAWRHFRRFISKYGKHLTSLRGNLPMVLPIHLSEACPQLRELILARPLPRNLQSILPIQHLQHLGLESMIDPESYKPGAFDWAISLPNIDHITFGTSGYNESTSIQRWKSKCGSHIHFDCVMSIADHYKKEDLVSTLNFPRGRTVENLGRMVIS